MAGRRDLMSRDSRPRINASHCLALLPPRDIDSGILAGVDFQLVLGKGPCQAACESGSFWNSHPTASLQGLCPATGAWSAVCTHEAVGWHDDLPGAKTHAQVWLCLHPRASTSSTLPIPADFNSLHAMSLPAMRSWQVPAFSLRGRSSGRRTRNSTRLGSKTKLLASLGGTEPAFGRGEDAARPGWPSRGRSQGST